MAGGTLAVDPFMLRDRPIGEALARVARVGFGAIELSHRDDLLPLFVEPTETRSSIDELRAACRSTGADIASVWAVYDWASPDEDRRRAATAGADEPSR